MFSATLADWMNVSWKTKDTSDISSSKGISRISFPPMRIAPRSTSQKRSNNCAAVVFPEPDSPTKACIFLSSKVIATSLSASSAVVEPP